MTTQHREYVITRPDTPLPWINYLGCEDYFGLISNTAGGYSFYRDARLRRLTRYRYNNAPLDFGGRYLYLRDNESGEFWSPSWQPTRRTLDSYACRHGLGYTHHRLAATRGIEAQTCYFVPLGENAGSLAGATSTNHRAEAAPSSRSSPASSSACGTRRTTRPTSSATSAPARSRWKTASSTTRPNTASGAITSPTSPAPARLAGFDTQRETFLGAYRGWDDPAAVERGRLVQLRSRTAGRRSARITSSSTSQPGETAQIIFVLGYHENPGRSEVRSARIADASTSGP